MNMKREQKPFEQRLEQQLDEKGTRNQGPTIDLRQESAANIVSVQQRSERRQNEGTRENAEQHGETPTIPGRVLDDRSAHQKVTSGMMRYGHQVNQGAMMDAMRIVSHHIGPNLAPNRGPGRLPHHRDNLLLEGPRQNLPAVVNHLPPALRPRENQVAIPGQGVPEWIKVRNLPTPSTNHQVLANLGRPGFAEFTRMDPAQIISMTTFTHDRRMVESVAGWAIQEHRRAYGNSGIRNTITVGADAQPMVEEALRGLDEDLRQGIGDLMQGYVCETISVVAHGMRYMLQRDFANGQHIADYLYAWPEALSVTPIHLLSNEAAERRQAIAHQPVQPAALPAPTAPQGPARKGASFADLDDEDFGP